MVKNATKSTQQEHNKRCLGLVSKTREGKNEWSTGGKTSDNFKEDKKLRWMPKAEEAPKI